jgi:glycosyltransferase involved in cell wall biosynthesis
MGSDAQLKVAHINLGDTAHYGGTAVAVARLNQALQRASVGSTVLCGYRDQQWPSFSRLPRPAFLRLIEAVVKRFTRECGLNDIHNISSFLLGQSHPFKEVEILNLHCIHHGYFNYLALPQLTSQKPTVYTMHDMWAFTGHCTYSFQCDRWKTGCGQCPDLTIVPSVKRDGTQIEWRLKRWAYEHSSLSIVSPSLWLANLLKESILRHHPIHYIPNGIDIDIYQPLDASECRSLLEIPDDKYVLMFGAAYLNDPRKGADLLIPALLELPSALKAKVVLLLFGSSTNNSIAEAVGITTINLGYITDDHQKVVAYSAADLFILPTRADNLPIVLQESLACGTPVLSFDVGGVSELVRPGVTGYLARPEDYKDLGKGIVSLLEDESLRSRMGFNCREIAVKEYSLDLQVKRYIELYENVLNNFRKV